jgi:hypothetical protein
MREGGVGRRRAGIESALPPFAPAYFMCDREGEIDRGCFPSCSCVMNPGNCMGMDRGVLGTEGVLPGIDQIAYRRFYLLEYETVSHWSLRFVMQSS